MKRIFCEDRRKRKKGRKIEKKRQTIEVFDIEKKLSRLN